MMRESQRYNWTVWRKSSEGQSVAFSHCKKAPITAAVHLLVQFKNGNDWSSCELSKIGNWGKNSGLVNGNWDEKTKLS
jgi:hypothetical protein